MRINTLTIISCLVLFGSMSVMAQNQTDKEGRKQGHWVKTAKNGKKIYEGNFKDGNPVDTFYYFDSKGKVTLKNIFTNDGRDNYAYLYYSDGTLKAEGNYINKNKEGKWLYYNEKGKRVTETYFVNNLKEGQEKVWDDHGKEVIQVTTFKAGKKNGEFFKSLYSDGYYTCYYKEDKLDGQYKEYFPSKTLRVSGQYKNGNKEGQWLVYTSNNIVIQKLTYIHDILVKDIIVVHTAKGDKELEQYEIALVRPTGKQTQIILVEGDKLGCMDDFELLLSHLNQDKFARMDEKAKVYVNFSIIEGMNEDGSLKTDVDLGVKIIPDADAKEFVKTLFRED